MLFGIRWGSLRTKIIAWSFVPTAIILAAVASVTLYAYQRVTEDLVLERDRELTRLSASRLVTELNEYASLLADVARTAESNDPALQRAALRRAGNRLVVFDGGVIILDTHGRVTAAHPERPEILGQDWSSRPYFREMVRLQGPVFSDVVADGPEGAETIVVAVPIKGSQGEFLGTMAGLFRLGATAVSPFYGSIVKLRIGESGANYLVDSTGRVIYHSDIDSMGDDFSRQAVVQQVLNGKVGAIRTRDANGRDIVAGFAPVPGTPWGLVTEESWAALIRPSQGYRQFLSLLLLLGILVPALVVTVGVRRITRPIMDLIAAAQEVAAGNFGQTISAPTGDELEELAKQFNLMSAQLQESYADLERKIADRTRELATLNAIAAVVSRSLDLGEILQNALDKTLEVTTMEVGGAFRLEEDAPARHGATAALILIAHRGVSEEFARYAARLPLKATLAGEADNAEQVVVRPVADIRDGGMRKLMQQEQLQLIVSVPLLAKGRLLGALNLGTRTVRSLAPEELSLLASIGQQVGVAMENARLYQQAEQLAVVEERSRLARELHDSVTQSLYSLTLFAAAGRRLAAAGDLARVQEYLGQVSETGRQALKEMRLLVYQLRPLALEQEGLVGALQHRLDAVEKRAGLETTLILEGTIELAAAIEEGLYRIAQETLNNALKHANATTVTVRLHACSDTVELEVVDNGSGFDPDTAIHAGGLGLVSMRERAERMGASLAVESAPGKGTTVRVVMRTSPRPRVSPPASNSG